MSELTPESCITTYVARQDTFDAQALSNFFASNTTLRSFSTGYVELTTADMKILSDGLKENNTLVEFFISLPQQLDTEAVNYLVDAFENNTSLERISVGLHDDAAGESVESLVQLNISEITVRTRSFRDDVLTILLSKPTLKSCYFSNHGSRIEISPGSLLFSQPQFCDEKISTILQASLVNSTISKVEIYSHNIDKQTINEIVSSCPSLKELHLSGTNCVGLETLLESKLEILDIVTCERNILPLKYNNTLKIFNLTLLGDDCKYNGKLLGEILSENTSLVELNLPGGSVDDFEAMIRGLANNHTLEKLSLNDTIDETIVDMITTLLVDNYTLKRITWNNAYDFATQEHLITLDDFFCKEMRLDRMAKVRRAKTTKSSRF